MTEKTYFELIGKNGLSANKIMSKIIILCKINKAKIVEVVYLQLHLLYIFIANTSVISYEYFYNRINTLTLNWKETARKNVKIICKVK